MVLKDRYAIEQKNGPVLFLRVCFRLGSNLRSHLSLLAYKLGVCYLWTYMWSKLGYVVMSNVGRQRIVSLPPEGQWGTAL